MNTVLCRFLLFSFINHLTPPSDLSGDPLEGFDPDVGDHWTKVADWSVSNWLHLTATTVGRCLMHPYWRSKTPLTEVEQFYYSYWYTIIAGRPTITLCYWYFLLSKSSEHFHQSLSAWGAWNLSCKMANTSEKSSFHSTYSYLQQRDTICASLLQVLTVGR